MLSSRFHHVFWWFEIVGDRILRSKLVRVIETTYYELLAVLLTGILGAFLRREPDVIVYCSGLRSPLLNGVLGPRFTAENVSRRVESIMAEFKNRQMPVRWILGPSSSPANLGDLLMKRGLLRTWGIPGMALDLSTLDREPLPKGLEIQEVASQKSLRTCCDTLAEGFGFRDEIKRGCSDSCVNYGMSPTQRWFLGYLNGKPVATSLLVLHEGIAGIYCVATIPEARGRGIGSAITREPLIASKAAGYQVAVLEASEMGLPVYRKLGFEQLVEFKTYTWSS